MSTKTVKLNSTLHEELKAISEKDGLVLQDLIEEKLTEVLEEKGIYNFDPSEVSFDKQEQVFNLKLSPSNLHALSIIIKRLCLNEKISNLTQLDNLLSAVKTLDGIQEQYKGDILKVDDFFRSGHNAILNAIRTAVDSDLEAVGESQTVFKTMEEAVNTHPKVSQAISEESMELLKIFDNDKKSIETRSNMFRASMIMSEFQTKIFMLPLSLLDNSNLDVATLPEYTNLSENVYFLSAKKSGKRYAYFAGDKFELINILGVDIDMDMIIDVSKNEYERHQ
jgi:hypothetical protein